MVYEGYDNMKAVRVAAKAQYNNKYGTFPHQASRLQACVLGAGMPSLH